MTFCESLITNILMVFNFFVAIIGLALIGIGIVAHIIKTYLTCLGSQFANIPIFIIVVGVVIFVIAFCGCFGASQKNRCMLRIYAAFLIIICLIEIGAGIAIYVLKGVLKDELMKNMICRVVDADNLNVTVCGGPTQTWELMQHELSCCGVEGKLRMSIIFEPVPYSVRNTSTCRTRSFESTFGLIQAWKDVRTPPSGLIEEECEDTSKYQKGCLQNIEHQLRSNNTVVGGIAIGIFVIQLFGIVFAYIIKTNSGETSDAPGIDPGGSTAPQPTKLIETGGNTAAQQTGGSIALQPIGGSATAQPWGSTTAQPTKQTNIVVL